MKSPARDGDSARFGGRPGLRLAATTVSFGPDGPVTSASATALFRCALFRGTVLLNMEPRYPPALTLQRGVPPRASADPVQGLLARIVDVFTVRGFLQATGVCLLILIRIVGLPLGA